MLRTGKHEGDIFFSKGYFLVSQDRIVGGQFEVDMNSISIPTCLHMKLKPLPPDEPSKER